MRSLAQPFPIVTAPVPSSGMIILEIIIALLLVGAIVVQHRVSGLTSNASMQQVAIQRRGAELLLFRATIALSVAFFAIPVLTWFFA